MELLCQVRGIRFRPEEARAEAASLLIGDIVTLEPEPDNKHDQNAVKVYANGVWIGYVQKELSEMVALSQARYASVNFIDKQAGQVHSLLISLHT